MTGSGPGLSRREGMHAAAVVMQQVPMDGWLDNPETGTWGVLDALFHPEHPARIRSGKEIPAVYAARHAWLERCRAWVAKQGLTLLSTQVPLSLQRDYEAATGDVWQTPAREVS